MSWLENVNDTESALRQLSVRNESCQNIDYDSGFDQWLEKAILLRKEHGTVYLIGNGASASMASHISADLAKNAKVHTEVFSDLSLITAIANDLSYEEVFAEPLRRRLSEGDMLVAISSSGESPNILSAVQTAKQFKASIITLSAMKPGNTLRTLGSLNFYVPAYTYGLAETCHAAILHYWVDRMTAITNVQKEYNFLPRKSYQDRIKASKIQRAVMI